MTDLCIVGRSLLPCSWLETAAWDWYLGFCAVFTVGVVAWTFWRHRK